MAYSTLSARGAITEIKTMRIAKVLPLAGVLAALAAPAMAATVGTAVTPLNIRSGPGPQYPVIGAIPTGREAVVNGCIRGSRWCQISYGGRQGWAYSQYLTMQVAGGPPAVLTQQIEQVPVVTYEPPAVETVGSAPPPVAGTLIEEPGAPPVAVTPPTTVNTYVTSHPVQPVILNGEVVLGAGLPQDVVLNPVPNYEYDYAYVNQVPVLVEPQTRRIVYVYR